MRCSSCEPVLDRYLEGTLSARRMADVRAHLASCASCAAVMEELRVVDGLLFTTRAPELPQNFTFAVMAEVNGMRAPRPVQHSFWSFLAIYPAAAWVAAIVAIAVTRTNPAWLLASWSASLSRLAAAAGSFNASFTHDLSPSMPTLAAFGFGVLAIDAALAAAVVALYFGVRPRVAALLAASREVSS